MASLSSQQAFLGNSQGALCILISLVKNTSMLREILDFIFHEADLLVELALPETDVIAPVCQLLSVRGLPLTRAGISLNQKKLLVFVHCILDDFYSFLQENLSFWQGLQNNGLKIGFRYHIASIFNH